MKNKPSRLPAQTMITEDDVRCYAYHLYEQGNRQSGNDLAHWFEATAFLRSTPAGNPPPLAAVAEKI